MKLITKTIILKNIIRNIPLEETIDYLTQIKSHFFVDGIIERPLTKNNKFIDNILFISKKSI